MWSEQLQLELVIVGENLRFYDPARGEWLRTYEKAETARQEATQRIEDEKQRAESETQRAEEEKQRAEAEAQRANTAEAELARLRTEPEALRQQY